jgi:hypothetical protein
MTGVSTAIPGQNAAKYKPRARLAGLGESKTFRDPDFPVPVSTIGHFEGGGVPGGNSVQVLPEKARNV